MDNPKFCPWCGQQQNVDLTERVSPYAGVKEWNIVCPHCGNDGVLASVVK